MHLEFKAAGALKKSDGGKTEIVSELRDIRLNVELVGVHRTEEDIYDFVAEMTAKDSSS